MVVSEIRPLKKVKRRVPADIHDFLSFPSLSVDGGGACFSDEPFRLAVRSFVKDYGRLMFPPSLFPSLIMWQIWLRVGDRMDDAFCLDVVEEDVARSRSVYCEQCRVVGWSGHPVCRKRYHFIIRSRNNQIEGSHRACSRCARVQSFSDSRCKTCNLELTADDLEDLIYLQLEDTTHLLHGVVHSNGYGHLLRLNGREGGSDILYGVDIMNFWDRLCQRLAVRKVSLMDLSMRYGTNYRLLHSVAKGHAWYGDWGYQFGTGSYALTSDNYQNAIHTLSNMPLSTFFFQGRGPKTQLQSLISFYQSISETELLTLKDLFSFLLTLIGELANRPSTEKPKSNTCSNMLCAWTRNDVERVEQSMIKLLTTNGNWVTRRALRGALCKVASPELLDYCLKHLGGRIAGNGMVVHTRCIHKPHDIEFRIEPMNNRVSPDLSYPSKQEIIDDLKYLYDSILDPETMANYRPQSMRELVVDSANKLLDCKHFIKDYTVEQAGVKNPFTIRLLCNVELEDCSDEGSFLPPELVVLPAKATVAELKIEATKCFKEVYIMFKRFYIQELPEFGRVEGVMSLSLLFGSGGSVRIRGRCNAKYGLDRFRAERGTETWKVDCICGAIDDDGERMLACDKCGVWQHTRCVGIDSSNEIPAKFLCKGCLDSYCADSKGSSGSLTAKEAEEIENFYDGAESKESKSLNNEDDPISVFCKTGKDCRDEIEASGVELKSRMFVHCV